MNIINLALIITDFVIMFCALDYTLKNIGWHNIKAILGGILTISCFISIVHYVNWGLISAILFACAAIFSGYKTRQYYRISGPSVSTVITGAICIFSALYSFKLFF